MKASAVEAAKFYAARRGKTEVQVHWTYKVSVYDGKYLEYIFPATTEARSSWLVRVLKKAAPKRRYQVSKMDRKVVKSCLTIAKFTMRRTLRSKPVFRRQLFENPQVAAVVGAAWKQQGGVFAFLDLHQCWVRSHPEVYRKVSKRDN